MIAHWTPCHVTVFYFKGKNMSEGQGPGYSEKEIRELTPSILRGYASAVERGSTSCDSDFAFQLKRAADIIETANSVGLTQDEERCLILLADAWNVFIKLPDIKEESLIDFRRIIDAAHAVIACRVAKRANPEVWR